MPGARVFDSSQQGGGRLFPISQMCKIKAQCVSGLMSLPRGAPCSGSSFPGQRPDRTEILSSSVPAICFKAIMLFERISQTRSPLVRNKLRVKKEETSTHGSVSTRQTVTLVKRALALLLW